MQHILKGRTLKEYWADEERAFEEKCQRLYDKYGDTYPYHEWATLIDKLRQNGKKERDFWSINFMRPDRLSTDEDWLGLTGDVVLSLLSLHDPEYNWYEPYNGRYAQETETD